MRILVIAPQPFYQERGTPIATRILVRVLQSHGHSVDVLTYHVGEDPQLEGVRVFRTPKIPLVHDVPIGFSMRKMLCDVLIGWKLLRLMRTYDYDVLHAVEEAVFLSLIARQVRRSLVVYDMDSSLAEQMLDKYRALNPLSGVLCRLERFAIARSDLVIAVCNDLATRARNYGTSTPIGVVEDVSLVADDASCYGADDLRGDLPPGTALALYVGNLEPYQGVGLLLDAIAALDPSVPLRLVAIGGSPAAIEEYRTRAARLGVTDRVRFAGPRAVANLGAYLAQADILVSPRLSGHNTPMKLYSYLGAGKAVLATRIRSHTQVLSDDCALLVAPNAADVATGLAALTLAPGLRKQLGAAAQRLAATRYSLEQYRRSMASAYRQLPALS
jgi:glycosyltransferase involved in cell wall biosynthesis